MIFANKAFTLFVYEQLKKKIKFDNLCTSVDGANTEFDDGSGNLDARA